MFIIINNVTLPIMVKIVCTVVSGARMGAFDWSPHPEKTALNKYYEQNKKHFTENYQFTLQNVTMKVMKITDKSKPDINFSFSN